MSSTQLLEDAQDDRMPGRPGIKSRTCNGTKRMRQDNNQGGSFKLWEKKALYWADLRILPRFVLRVGFTSLAACSVSPLFFGIRVTRHAYPWLHEITYEPPPLSVRQPVLPAPRSTGRFPRSVHRAPSINRLVLDFMSQTRPVWDCHRTAAPERPPWHPN